MKPIYTILFPVLFLFASCTTKTVYVPTETIRIEYRERMERDSVYLRDSIHIQQKGDTIFFEKYAIRYRTRLVCDSVFKTDTVQIPYPVVEVREVSRVSGFQHFQIWCGRILLILVFGYVSIRCLLKR